MRPRICVRRICCWRVRCASLSQLLLADPTPSIAFLWLAFMWNRVACCRSTCGTGSLSRNVCGNAHLPQPHGWKKRTRGCAEMRHFDQMGQRRGLNLDMMFRGTAAAHAHCMLSSKLHSIDNLPLELICVRQRFPLCFCFWPAMLRAFQHATAVTPTSRAKRMHA